MYIWGSERRFNSYANYFRQHFGERIQKVTIDAGFTCPNRDGTAGRGGCTYCDNKSFNPSYCSPKKSVTQQIEEGIEFHSRRYKNANKFLAYFQAFSNTYAPLDELKKLYEEALENPNIVGIILGTRPDCIDNDKLDYLEEIAKEKYVAIEYGIESCYDKTLERINRCHDFQCAVDAIKNTAGRNIKIGAHFMFGLPGETLDDMLNMAPIISKLEIDTVKFHQLQIIKGTKMAKEFIEKTDDFYKFSVESYINFFATFIENLNPAIIIERFAGEVPPKYLEVAPWSSLRNDQLINLFEKRLEELDTWQGRLYK